jgi:2-polyprenyl-3-methyl-5-hydroxy-6-metoxy-1,4-benzoquinol methylase
MIDDKTILEDYLATSGHVPQYLKTHAKRFADLVNVLTALGVSEKKVLDVAGNDISRQILKRYIKVDYMSTLRSDVEIDPWAEVVGENMYDFVLCTEVIEHMNADPAHLLNQINKTLKLGSYLVLSTVNIASYVGIYNQVVGHAPYVMGGLFGRRGDRHHREYAPKELTYLIAANGFECQTVTRQYYDDTPHKLIAKAWIMKTIPKIDIDDYNDTILVIAKKVAEEPLYKLYPVYHKSVATNLNGKIENYILNRSSQEFLSSWPDLKGHF